MKPWTALFILLANLVWASGSSAQPFPSKPVRVIIGVPPGNTLDIGARLLGAEMTKRLGQQVIVENRPGASNSIAAKTTASAPADGYSLFYGFAVLFHPLFLKNNAVDATKELAPVSNLQIAPYVAHVRSSLGVRSLQELVAYSKANPGRLTFGSATPLHDLLMAMLKNSFPALDYRSIPYYKTADPGPPLISEEIDFTITSAGRFLPQIESGKVHAMFGTARSSAIRNMPSLSDLGQQKFSAALNYYGLWAPVGTPRTIVQTINAAAVASMKDPELSKKLFTMSAYETVGSTPEEQLALFQESVKFWAEAVRLTNFQPQ